MVASDMAIIAQANAWDNVNLDLRDRNFVIRLLLNCYGYSSSGNFSATGNS
jgi:hypothetical protein